MGLISNVLRNTDKRCLYKFIYNMGVKGSLSFYRFQKRKGKPGFFPAFHFISVTDDCNLHCQGCWVVDKKKNSRLTAEQIDQIITQTKQNGSYFFGILGGEPLLYKNLFPIFEKHSDCYFQLFTNGTLLTPEMAEKLRKVGNVTPLVSYEGNEEVADIRRGGQNVWQSANKAISASVNAGLITGAAISVCKSNFDMALSPEFVQGMVKQGVTYLWYYIFRPVGSVPGYDLALSPEELQKLRSFIVDARVKFSIAIIDTYWDADGKPFCPAAEGLSHHINAAGFIEPCPVVQFAKDHVSSAPLKEIYANSEFLAGFREQVKAKTNGCIIMEDPAWLARFVRDFEASDTSGRNNELERLESAPSFPGHGTVDIIPEKSRLYRFAKRRAFFGLGAYG